MVDCLQISLLRTTAMEAMELLPTPSLQPSDLQQPRAPAFLPDLPLYRGDLQDLLQVQVLLLQHLEVVHHILQLEPECLQCPEWVHIPPVSAVAVVLPLHPPDLDHSWALVVLSLHLTWPHHNLDQGYLNILWE